MSDARESELLQQVRVRDAELARLKEELQRAQLEIADLKQRLDEMARRYFGKSSEQLDPNQLQLLLQELVAPGPAVGKESGPEAAEAPAPEPEKTAPRGPRER